VKRIPVQMVLALALSSPLPASALTIKMEKGDYFSLDCRRSGPWTNLGSYSHPHGQTRIIDCGNATTGEALTMPDASYQIQECKPDAGGSWRKIGDNGHIRVTPDEVVTITCAASTAEAPPAAPPPPSSETGVQAASLGKFVRSIGVNTHIGQGYSASAYIPQIQYLGIKSIRDNPSGNMSGHLSVAQQTGAKFVLGHTTGDLTFVLNANKTLANAGALIAIEGPNEPNNWAITYQGQTGGQTGSWLAISNFMRDMVIRKNADPVLAPYPVWTISEAGGQTSNAGLQFLTVPNPAPAGVQAAAGTKHGDYLNVHPYLNRSGGAISDNIGWNNAQPQCPQTGNFDAICWNHGKLWRSGYTGYSNEQLAAGVGPGTAALKRVATEYCWCNPDVTGGKIDITAMFDFFARGYEYSFRYQMVDNQGGGGTHGFFPGPTTANPRPVAVYTRNLMLALAENGDRTSLGQLAYSIANLPATMHHMLLQHSNGKFWIAVWSERASGTNSVTVNLAKPRAQVRVFDPTASATPAQTLNNTGSVPVSIAGYGVRLIEITP
jgi:hypothetical protein